MGDRAHGGEDDVPGSWMGRRLTGSRIPTGVGYGGQGRGVVQQSMGVGVALLCRCYGLYPVGFVSSVNEEGYWET